MSIRLKTLLILGTLLLASTAGFVVISQISVARGFEQVEDRAIQQDVERAHDAIWAELGAMNAKGTDWTIWDDTYQFMSDVNKPYIEANLGDSIAGQAISFWAFYNKRNQLIHVAGYDLKTLEPRPFPSSLRAALGSTSPLLGDKDTAGKEVILNLADGPYLVVARPVLRSDRSGPPNGTVVFITPLDADKISQLSSTTHLSIALFSVNEPTLPADVAQYLSAATKSSEPTARPLSPNKIAGYTTLADGLGGPGLVLRVTGARDIYHQGQQSLTYLYTALAGLGIGMMIVVVLLLNVYVSGPVSKLAKIVGSVKDYTATRTRLELSARRNDEVGKLARSIGDMLASLDLAHRELASEKALVDDKVVERTKELNTEKARLHASIDSLTIGYLLTTPNKTIALVNAAAKHILARTEAGRADGHRLGLLSGDDLSIDDLASVIGDAFDIGRLVDTAVGSNKNITRKSVPYRQLYVNIYVTPVQANHDGAAPIGAVILIEDVTDQKLLDRSRDEFFSIASHELRTPLTAIRGNASLLQTKLADFIKNEMAQEIVTDIHDSSVRLIRIVNDFLDVSRLEQGRLKFDREVFDLVELSRTAVREYTVTGSRKKLYLRVVEPSAPMPQVFADPNRVRQVLVNLIGNGMKFTQEGGVELTFKDTARDVQVDITDTGMGIPSDSIKLLFRKFQQAESNILTRDTVQGTGLGLYISRNLLKGMNGSIEIVKTEVGKGTTFRVSIPKATKHQLDDQAEPHNA